MIKALLQTIAAWSLIFPGIFALGSLFKSFVPFADKQLRGIFYFALGLVILSYLMIVIHYLGILNSWALWGLCGVIFIFGLSRFSELRDWLAGWKDLLFKKNDPLQNILGILSVSSFFVLLAGTLTPEIGGDALTYQIYLPKEFLRRGSLSPIPFDDNSLFPLLMNNLYLVGFGTGGVFAAKLFHFFTGFLLALSLAQVVKLETGNNRLALFCGLALWVTPLFFNLLSTTYVDVSAAAFIFWALLALVEALRRVHLKAFFISGLLAGASVAVKYLSLTGVFALVLAGFFYIFFIKPLNKSDLWKALSLCTAGVLIGCGYWLIRNWVATGNPFYPYWGFLFGLDQRAPMECYDMGVGKNLFAYLFSFLNMVLYPNSFGMSATRISPIYFPFVPFAVYAAFRVKSSRPYFVFFLSLYTVWFFLVQADRWGTSLFPPFLLAAAVGLHAVRERFSASIRKIAIVLAFALVTLETLGGIYHYRYAYYLFSGVWSIKEYERKMERTVPIAEWINANLPKEAVILIEAEPRKFYINRPMIQNKNFSWHTKYTEKGLPPEQILKFYKEHGITHLLLSDSLSQPSQEERPLLKIAQSEDFAALLAEVPSENFRDERFVYRLYQLKA